jgi:hypothetical protein
MKKYLLAAVLLFAAIQNAHAVFPEDFSDVVWVDPNISSWPETAQLTVAVNSTSIILNSTKTNVWPARGNPILGNSNFCCNANAWVFAKFGDKWYAATWEWLKKGQTAKFRSAFEGNHTRRPPFCCNGQPAWVPKNGEIYGLMVSGFARFGIAANIQERSNIAFYQWGVGPVDASVLLPEPEPENVPIAPMVDMIINQTIN